MYPRISDLFQDLFGIDLVLPLYSFGLMVAVAILIATAMTRLELDRLYARGLIGSVMAKEKDGKGRVRTVQTSPSALVWTMMLMAGGFGIAGSKLFHIIDYWDQFVQNPLRMVFSPSGLTFYGGLVCASIAIALYARHKSLNVPRLADAIAPGLMLAYGIGRIGCYLSGDGDWGVCSSLAQKPAWLPGFLWSETFPRNVVAGLDAPPVDPIVYNSAVRGEACALASPTGVYPTMLYEFAACALLAAGLWLLRKHPYKGGWLFSIYLILAGIERFTVEIIRVNPVVAFGLSQSQLISIALVVLGVVGLAVTTRRVSAPPAHAVSTAGA